jgi:LPXTG-motif cell wall-anchored protein
VSINRRTAIAVRSIGVVSAAAALALGVGGTAFACSITEFTANVVCDGSTGSADIVVTDSDTSRTSADVTVFVGDKVVGSGKFDSPQAGDTIHIPVPWQADTTYRVHVKTKQYNVDSDVTKGDLSTSGRTCAAPTTAPPVTTPPTTAPTSAPATTPATSPSSTTSAPAVADTNAPSPAAGGGQDLAETGGGSNTGMIAGIAAVLVAVGGGAVFALRRRTATARH